MNWSDLAKLINTVAGTGITGVLLILSVWINYLMYKDNKNLQQQRVNDAKDIAKTISEPLENIKITMSAMLTILQAVQSGVNQNKEKDQNG